MYTFYHSGTDLWIICRLFDCALFSGTNLFEKSFFLGKCFKFWSVLLFFRAEIGKCLFDQKSANADSPLGSNDCKPAYSPTQIFKNDQKLSKIIKILWNEIFQLCINLLLLMTWWLLNLMTSHALNLNFLFLIDSLLLFTY